MASMQEFSDWRRENNKQVLDTLIPMVEEKHGPEAAIGEASRWTQLHHIDRLVSSGVNVDCRVGEKRITPLMMAGKKAAAKRLLELGADVNATDGEGHTALMWVFLQLFRKNESLARTRLLIEHGADVNMSDRDGLKAYDYAIRRGDTACAELLKTTGR